eukprot:748167-Hanusia_phi.AAC.2
MSTITETPLARRMLNSVARLQSRSTCSSSLAGELVVRGWPHLLLVALRDIEPDEELLTDYGSGYWENRLLKDELLWDVKCRVLELLKLLE